MKNEKNNIIDFISKSRRKNSVNVVPKDKTFSE